MSWAGSFYRSRDWSLCRTRRRNIKVSSVSAWNVRGPRKRRYIDWISIQKLICCTCKCKYTKYIYALSQTKEILYVENLISKSKCSWLRISYISRASTLNPRCFVGDARAMVSHLQPGAQKYCISGFIRVSHASGIKVTCSKQGRFFSTQIENAQPQKAWEELGKEKYGPHINILKSQIECNLIRAVFPERKFPESKIARRFDKNREEYSDFPGERMEKREQIIASLYCSYLFLIFWCVYQVFVHLMYTYVSIQYIYNVYLYGLLVRKSKYIYVNIKIYIYIHIHSSFLLNMNFSCLNCCVLPYWYLYEFYLYHPFWLSLFIKSSHSFITFAFADWSFKHVVINCLFNLFSFT